MNILIFLALFAILLAVDCQIHGTQRKTRLDLAIQAERKKLTAKFPYGLGRNCVVKRI